jgi:hypothetical protein
MMHCVVAGKSGGSVQVYIDKKLKAKVVECNQPAFGFGIAYEVFIKAIKKPERDQSFFSCLHSGKKIEYGIRYPSLSCYEMKKFVASSSIRLQFLKEDESYVEIIEGTPGGRSKFYVNLNKPRDPPPKPSYPVYDYMPTENFSPEKAAEKVALFLKNNPFFSLTFAGVNRHGIGITVRDYKHSSEFFCWGMPPEKEIQKKQKDECARFDTSKNGDRYLNEELLTDITALCSIGFN